jgi:hypothetical protein
VIAIRPMTRRPDQYLGNAVSYQRWPAFHVEPEAFQSLPSSGWRCEVGRQPMPQSGADRRGLGGRAAQTMKSVAPPRCSMDRQSRGLINVCNDWSVFGRLARVGFRAPDRLAPGSEAIGGSADVDRGEIGYGADIRHPGANVYGLCARRSWRKLSAARLGVTQTPADGQKYRQRQRPFCLARSTAKLARSFPLASCLQW